MKISRSFYRSMNLLIVIFLIPSACSSPRVNRVSTSPETSTATVLSNTPTATPSPNIYLVNLTPVGVNVGAGGLGLGIYNLPNISFNGERIHSHGQDYPYGLLAHAPSSIDYRLDGKYRVFRTQILKQDNMTCGDGVIFKVLLDGQEVYVSDVISSLITPQNVELDVAGVQVLSLVVDARKTGDCDWSIWGNPLLVPLSNVAQNYPTATLNPNMPCNNTQQDTVYVFLDCNDVRRIRHEVTSNSVTRVLWSHLLTGTNNFLAQFPTSYSPTEDPTWMWLDFMPRNIALAYLVTGDPKYAKGIIRLLDIVVVGTPPRVAETGRPESGLMVVTGHFASSFQSMLFSYMVVRDIPYLDKQRQSTLDSYFIHQAQYLDAFSGYVDSYITDMWNQYIQADASIAMIGLALPDNPLSSNLYSHARQRLQARLKNWFDHDGGWREYADNYSPLVLRSILLYAETEFHHGNDIYQTDFSGKNLHTLCRWYLDLLPPDGMQPAMGDGAWEGALDPGLLRLCSLRTSDPTLAFASDRYLSAVQNPNRSEWNIATDYYFDTVAWSDATLPANQPDWKSELLTDSGLAILRSGWDQQAQYMLMEFVDDGLHRSNTHLHKAFGNVVLYDDGLWILDNSYHQDTQAEWDASQSTMDHSTLTLDNMTQVNTSAQKMFFSMLGEVGMASINAFTYPNLRHQRTVLWSAPWHQWLVLDDAFPSPVTTGHTLQLRWYVSKNTPDYTLRAQQETRQDSGSRWIFTRNWGGKGTLTVDLLPNILVNINPIARQYKGTWRGSATGIELDVMPSAWPVRLVSLLTSNLGNAQAVSNVTRVDSTDATLVSSQRTAQEWVWILARAPSTNATVSTYTLDGQAACINTNADNILGYCLFAGATLIDNDRQLVKANIPISVYTDFAKDTVSTDSPKPALVSIYWPLPIASITESGATVTFTVDQGIVSFNISSGQHTLKIK